MMMWVVFQPVSEVVTWSSTEEEEVTASPSRPVDSVEYHNVADESVPAWPKEVDQYNISYPLLHYTVMLDPDCLMPLGHRLHGLQPVQELEHALGHAICHGQTERITELEKDLEEQGFSQEPGRERVPILYFPWIGSGFAYQSEQPLIDEKPGLLFTENKVCKTHGDQAKPGALVEGDHYRQDSPIRVVFHRDQKTQEHTTSLKGSTPEVETLAKKAHDDCFGARCVLRRCLYCRYPEAPLSQPGQENSVVVPLWVRGVKHTKIASFLTRQVYNEMDLASFPVIDRNAIRDMKYSTLNDANHKPSWSVGILRLSLWLITMRKSGQTHVPEPGKLTPFLARPGPYTPLQAYAYMDRLFGVCRASGRFSCGSRLTITLAPDDFLFILFGIRESELCTDGKRWAVYENVQGRCQPVPGTPCYWTPGAKLLFLCEMFAYFDDSECSFLRAFLNLTTRVASPYYKDLQQIFYMGQDCIEFWNKNRNRVFAPHDIFEMQPEFEALGRPIFLDPSEKSMGALFYSKEALCTLHRKLKGDTQR